MKLTRLRIENFRSFGPAPSDISLLGSVTAFVGNNGAGKTAIMAALARLFGVGAGQRGIRKSDFHVAVGDAGPADGDELAIDCIFSFPGGADDPVVPEIIRHMSIGPDGAELLVRMRLQASWSDDGTSDGLVDEEVRWVPTGGDAFDWSACTRVNASDRALVQLVYVPANRNAYDQVTALLKGRLWRAARWSGDLQSVVEAGAVEVQGRFDAEAPAALIIGRLEERWRQVHLADTDAVPRLGVSAATLDDLVRRAEFLFSPGPAGRERRLGELSDGQRSLFHIALTAATIEVEQAAWAQAPSDCVFDQSRLRRTYLTLLAIEEPENSLSPFFLSRIMQLARDLAALGGAQVLVSSHSASILGRVEPEEVRHVRLDPAAKRSAVRELTLPTAGGEAGDYVRLAIRAYPELYFARFVILAEGESEAIVLPRVAEAMGMPLDRSFVPIVPLGGRFVSHFWRLLRELEIPHATLLDLDAGRKHGGAATIAYAVRELRRIGRDLAANPLALAGDIDPREVDEIEDADLVEDDQRHAWLRALREEGVFFSTPIDLDFAMLCQFPDAYRVVRPGGRGPRMGEDAVREKKATVLKTEGTPAIYNNCWNELFAWYPYLFLGASKPATHLAALGRIAEEDLHVDAPPELLALLEAVRHGLGL